MRHLAKGDDTLYSISKAIGHPIQSVMKALKVLTERGYVVCERRESTRRKGVEANVCRLTELGKLAAIALGSDVELEVPAQQLPIFGGLISIVSSLWLKNEKLRNVYKEALMMAMTYANLEGSYRDLPREDAQRLILSTYYLSAISVAAQARNVVLMKVKEYLERRGETLSSLSEAITFSTTTTFELPFVSLFIGGKLKELETCDEEVRRILIETARECLRSEIPLFFNDYIIRLLFLGSLETAEDESKWIRLNKLVDELDSINKKIYMELGLLMPPTNNT